MHTTLTSDIQTLFTSFCLGVTPNFDYTASAIIRILPYNDSDVEKYFESVMSSQMQVSDYNKILTSYLFYTFSNSCSQPLNDPTEIKPNRKFHIILMRSNQNIS